MQTPIPSNNGIIQTSESLVVLARRIKETTTPLTIDTETNGLFPKDDSIVGWSIAFSEEEGYYIPTKHRTSLNIPQHLIEQLFTLLLKKKLIYHNAKFDIQMIAENYGIKLPVYADTYAMAYLACFPKLALKEIMKDLFHYETKEFDQLLSEKFGKTWHSAGYTAADLTAEEISDYAIHDVLYTYKLFNLLAPEMQNYASIWKLELNLIPIVAEMNLTGLEIDAPLLRQMSLKGKEEVVKRLQAMREVAGQTFEPNSTRQVAKVLFEQLNLPITKRTKSGAPSTDKDVLEELSSLHTFPKQLVEYRSLNKFISGYLDKIPTIVEHTGKLYANFANIGAESGRFTCPGVSNWQGLDMTVNLQNQPVNDDYEVRAAFVVPEGYTWVKCDYKQQEYRMMCNLAGEAEAIQKFRDGVDFHTMTAKMMLDIPADVELTREQRQIGKVLNFGISYGMTVPTIAKMTGHTEAEAEQLYNKYFEALPKLHSFILWCQDQVKATKMVKTLFGRVRKLDYEGLPKRVADDIIKKGFNTVIQGSCADITKISMLRVKDRVLDVFGSDIIKMVLQVHDELDFYVRTDKLAEVLPVLKSAMTIPTPDNWCDFDIDCETGVNWSESSHEDWTGAFERDKFEGWGKVLPARFQTYLTDPEFSARW